MHSCTNEPGSTWTVGPRATPFLGAISHFHVLASRYRSAWVTLKTSGAMESGKAGRRELGCESYAMQRLVTQTDVHHLGAKAGASSSEMP